eukprot:UN01665
MNHTLKTNKHEHKHGRSVHNRRVNSYATGFNNNYYSNNNQKTTNKSYGHQNNFSNR